MPRACAISASFRHCVLFIFLMFTNIGNSLSLSSRLKAVKLKYKFVPRVKKNSRSFFYSPDTLLKKLPWIIFFIALLLNDWPLILSLAPKNNPSGDVCLHFSVIMFTHIQTDKETSGWRLCFVYEKWNKNNISVIKKQGISLYECILKNITIEFYSNSILAVEINT